MKSLAVYDIAGKKSAKSVKLPTDIFEQKSSDRLLALYARVYLANQRSWSASVKTRSDIRASKRKIYRQKGTGRARHGALSAPIFVGGGIAHGPKTKDKKLKINKKQTRKALFASLSKANQEGRIFVISDTVMKNEPKTKKIEKFLKGIGALDKKTLFVYPAENPKSLILSARNLPNINLSEAKLLNAYQVLSNDTLIFTQSALSSFIEHFSK